MDVAACAPGEPEETDRQQERTDHGTLQSLFRRQRRHISCCASELRFFLIRHSIDGDEACCAQCTAQSDTKEDKSRLATVEVVDLYFWVGGLEDQWESSEKGEEDCKVEGCVDTEIGNDRFGDEHSCRAEECDCQDELHACPSRR